MPSKWPSNPAMRTKLVLVLGLLLAAASAQALEFRSVKSHGAIMHEAPWASSKKLYVLSQGYPVEVIGSQPDWVRVRDAAGGVAWMSTASLSNQRTVVVTANRTELRRSPDAKAALAFSGCATWMTSFLSPFLSLPSSLFFFVWYFLNV